MRLSKNIKIFINYFLGPLLFIWLLYVIIMQVRTQPHLEESWSRMRQVDREGVFLIALTLLLMFVNWGLEAAKWKLSLRDVHAVSFFQAYKAVLSGVSISVTTPNRVGEYLGRMLYMPEGKRLKVIAVTLVGSLSQLLVTLITGAIGLLVLRKELIADGLVNPLFFTPLCIGVGAVVLILTVFYFNLSRIEKWFETLFRQRSWLYLVAAVQGFGSKRLFAILLLSFARYCTFVIQYIALFRLFRVDVPAVTLFWLMSLVFLALAVIPTVAVVVEFGVRGEVCLQLVGLFTANSLGIVLTSLSIWLVNLVIPALIGSLLILGIRVFKSRERKNEMTLAQNSER
jgi:hypothetical protein